jgi:hypothetical protein
MQPEGNHINLTPQAHNMLTVKAKKCIRAYSFLFNGQESDNETFNSAGASYTAQFWQYDSRIGRRWNLDPRPNPSTSYYATFAGNPVWYSDPLGDIGKYKHRKYTINTDDKGNVSYKFGRKGKSLSQMSKHFQKKFNKNVNPIYQAMAQTEGGRKDINYIKPSIAEATRVLLRRVPYIIFVRDLKEIDIAHILILAEEKGVEVIEDRELPYKALAIIEDVIK